MLCIRLFVSINNAFIVFICCLRSLSWVDFLAYSISSSDWSLRRSSAMLNFSSMSFDFIFNILLGSSREQCAMVSETIVSALKFLFDNILSMIVVRKSISQLVILSSTSFPLSYSYYSTFMDIIYTSFFYNAST